MSTGHPMPGGVVCLSGNVLDGCASALQRRQVVD
jgi:hypothetical protein